MAMGTGFVAVPTAAAFEKAALLVEAEASWLADAAPGLQVAPAGRAAGAEIGAYWSPLAPYPPHPSALICAQVPLVVRI